MVTDVKFTQCDHSLVAKYLPSKQMSGVRFAVIALFALRGFEASFRFDSVGLFFASKKNDKKSMGIRRLTTIIIGIYL